MQTQPNFKQLLEQFVADLEADQAKVKAASADPDWDLYYKAVEAKTMELLTKRESAAVAAKAYFDSKMAVQRAIL